MRAGQRGRLLFDDRGGVAVEFVALLPAFVFLTFFIFEIGIAVFLVGTVEKAAQLGARLAVVSNFAVTNLAPGNRNQVAMNAVPGQNCPAACVGFPTRFCDGGTSADCDAADFTAIFTRMDNIAGLLQPSNVTVTYQYIGLGFAGGPIVPRVTVTVRNVPYGLFMTAVMNGFVRLATGNPNATLDMTNLPTITATYTGEDLSSAVAS
jgi:Flp pilus assembly protein TadG